MENKDNIENEPNQEKQLNLKEDDELDNQNNVSDYNNEEDIRKNRKIEVIEDINVKTDLSFKIIIIGDSSVGKSSLANQAVKKKFDFSYHATLGFEYLSFFVKIDNKIIKLQIWDTCGQEIYQSLIANFYRNSSLAIMVYGINNRTSFEHIDHWLKEIKRSSNPDAKIILIGNKVDLEDERVVSYEEAKKYAEDLEFSNFFETSAKSGFNIQEVFIEAANLLYDDYIEYKSQSKGNSTISFGEKLKINEDKDEGQAKSFCC